MVHWLCSPGPTAPTAETSGELGIDWGPYSDVACSPSAVKRDQPWGPPFQALREWAGASGCLEREELSVPETGKGGRDVGVEGDHLSSVSFSGKWG